MESLRQEIGENGSRTTALLPDSRIEEIMLKAYLLPENLQSPRSRPDQQ